MRLLCVMRCVPVSVSSCSCSPMLSAPGCSVPDSWQQDRSPRSTAGVLTEVGSGHQCYNWQGHERSARGRTPTGGVHVQRCEDHRLRGRVQMVGSVSQVTDGPPTYQDTSSVAPCNGQHHHVIHWLCVLALLGVFGISIFWAITRIPSRVLEDTTRFVVRACLPESGLMDEPTCTY